MTPNDPRLRWRDVRTGVLVLLGLVPLALGIFFLDAVRRAFVEGPELVLIADEIRGLTPGTDVWLAGRPAGRVADISVLNPGEHDGNVAVLLVLHRDAAPALRRDARGRIGPSALLAPPVVKLHPGSPGAPPFDFRDTLYAAGSPDIDDFRAFADSARRVARGLQADLARLDATVSTGGGLLARLRRDPGLIDGFERRRARAVALREAWREGDGIPAAWRDTALHGRATRAAAEIRRLAAPAGRTAADVGAAAAVADSLRARLARLARRLDAAEGTMGRLATDDELGRQVERTRAQLDSLVVDAGARPLRYLRFRLF